MEKEKLCSLLREAEKPLSYEDIARGFHCEISNVIGEINELKNSGYRILESDAHVFLWENSGCPKARELLSLMPKEYRGRLLVREKLTSTNDIAKFLASAGAPEKSVVVALCQNAGKGRNSHSFYSPAMRGIYYTMILRPRSALDVFRVTACTAVAVNSAIEKVCSARAGIKWLNDLIINGKKVCGILAEACFDEEKPYIVVGVGINVSGERNDFPIDIREKASSLEAELQIKIDINRLIRALTAEMDEIACLSGNIGNYLERYRESSVTLGREVSIAYGETTIRYAHAEAINEDFSLRVVFSDGKTENITSGEVSVRGLTGYI